MKIRIEDAQMKLEAGSTTITDVCGAPICTVTAAMYEGTPVEIARRLAACWGACMGMGTKSLEMMCGDYYGAQQHSIKQSMKRLRRRPRKRPNT